MSPPAARSMRRRRTAYALQRCWGEKPSASSRAFIHPHREPTNIEHHYGDVPAIDFSARDALRLYMPGVRRDVADRRSRHSIPLPEPKLQSFLVEGGSRHEAIGLHTVIVFETANARSIQTHANRRSIDTQVIARESRAGIAELHRNDERLTVDDGCSQSEKQTVACGIPRNRLDVQHMVAQQCLGSPKLSHIGGEPRFQSLNALDAAHEARLRIERKAHEAISLESRELRLRPNDVEMAAIERHSLEVSHIGRESDRNSGSLLFAVARELHQKDLAGCSVVDEQQLVGVGYMRNAGRLELAARNWRRHGSGSR